LERIQADEASYFLIVCEHDGACARKQFFLH
jgi:hypothetical protein